MSVFSTMLAKKKQEQQAAPSTSFGTPKTAQPALQQIPTAGAASATPLSAPTAPPMAPPALQPALPPMATPLAQQKLPPAGRALPPGGIQSPIAEGTFSPPQVQAAGFEKQWQDIQNAQAGNLAAQLSGVGAATAAQGRQMANLNALAGRSVGGAFAGGAAQTALGGMQMAQGIRAQHGKEQIQAKMAWLDKQMEIAENTKQRDLQEKIAAEQNALQRELAELGGQVVDDPGTGGVVGGTDSPKYATASGDIYNMRDGKVMVNMPNMPGQSGYTAYVTPEEMKYLEKKFGGDKAALYKYFGEKRLK